MAYWQWRNKGGTVVNPPANNPVVTPPTNNVPRVSSTNWKAEFFNNLSLAGGPVLTQDLGSGNQNFSRNWGYGSPGSAVSSDNFSARVTTQRYFAPGTYQIQTTSDDGVRVRIGNQTVINKWIDQASTNHYGTFTTTGGNFNVSVEYYERGGAANLSFTANSIYSFSGSTTINGASFGWDLSQYNANGKTKLQIDPNKQTIVVAHGKVNNASDGVGNLEQLARTAASTFGNAQVIFLDWRNASADSNTRPTEAGKRIGAVANGVAQALKNLGLNNADNLYFYGHSLGSLLLTKVAENYGKVAGFASLDPAFAAEDYDLDNDGNTWEDELPDISSIATRSISLVAEDADVIGVAGDNNYAMTAQRAFIVNFSNFNFNVKTPLDPIFAFHNSVVDVFTGMLRSGLEINLLATASDILDNQWGQDASQKLSYSVGNYKADGVINARFLNNNSSLVIDDLLFLDSSKQRRTRSIGQQLRV
jgi:pimeloyl-ACP methyl ester carboxylesterase